RARRVQFCNASHVHVPVNRRWIHSPGSVMRRRLDEGVAGAAGAKAPRQGIFSHSPCGTAPSGKPQIVSNSRSPRLRLAKPDCRVKRATISRPGSPQMAPPRSQPTWHGN
ncbi:unnamed protein product, partial [Effrenium voratum]